MGNSKGKESSSVSTRELTTIEIWKDGEYAANAVFRADDMLLVTGCNCRDEEAAFELIRILKRIAAGIRASILFFASDASEEHDSEMLQVLEALEAEPGPEMDGRYRTWWLRIEPADNGPYDYFSREGGF